jgi:chromosome segregation ATPase
MAIRIEKNDEVINGNGWIRYQQLVLSELERHEAKLNILETEIIAIRLTHVRLETELKNNTETLNKVLIELKTLEQSMSAKVSTLNTEREKMSSDLTLLKWKVAGAATFIATVFTVILQTVAKFFLQGG